MPESDDRLYLKCVVIGQRLSAHFPTLIHYFLVFITLFVTLVDHHFKGVLLLVVVIEVDKTSERIVRFGRNSKCRQIGY